ncbi:MAG: McrC family protein [Chloroflexi bacterium]|nr:McrC family protein [Bacteroidota bacterium]MCL5110978.1 McrC family protein [Chloroflexota bacterium]
MGAEILRPTVRQGERALQSTQFVGVVRLGTRTIQVLPKTYRSEDTGDRTAHIRDATRNLLYMLAYVGSLSVREQELVPLLQRDLDWFEILTHLFASHLAEEWKRGAHRTYQSNDDELPILRGKWRVGEQLRRLERQHTLCVTYDEFTTDNPLNQVFRFVTERLWHLTRDAGNRELLADLRQWMDDVALAPAMNVTAASPTLITRLNQRFAPLLNLARLFLDGSSLQMAAGDVANFSLMFDMNSLFEAFAVAFISRHRLDVLPDSLQTGDLLPQSRGVARWLARREDTQVFKLRPDLVVRSQGSCPLLLDAKYKQLNPRDVALGVGQDDFYQMHAYAQCYDCSRIVMLYPQTAEMTEALHAEFTFERGQTSVAIGTLDLRVDLGSRQECAKIAHYLKALLGREEPGG